MAIILIDFDNTITNGDYNYPEMTDIRENAKCVINKYYDLGHCIIINTCRYGDDELNVKNYLIEHGVKFCHINQNCKVRVKQYNNDTRKLGGHISIDDKDINSIINGINWEDIDSKLSYILSHIDMSHDLCNERCENAYQLY